MGYIKHLIKVKCSLSRNRLLCSDTTILPQIPGVYKPILQHLPGLWGPLDYQSVSIKMEEDWGGQEIASWPHAKAAVGKLMGLAVSDPEERLGVAMAQTLHWSHHNGALVLSRKEHGDKDLCLGERSLDRSPFGCWKELSNDIRGWHSHVVGTL